MKVLIIEDEKAMAAEMLAYLEKAYCCDLAYTARQGLEKMDENQYDFILLDLGLPDKDGLLLLQEARKNCPEASYIILTARGQLEDRIRGLQMGADDYLPKPFSLPELLARMQAISRRKFGLTDSKIALGDFDIDLHQRSVFFENQEISLSRREFDLLSYMLLHKNRPLTRMQLSEHIWGNFSDDDYDSNYIDVHIKNIRKKLSAFASVEWLQTLRHVGYKIKL
ncbi:DNA-binding response regulator, OmpR family, contains REC and winged-helix (wHTH) domain [Chitinophaga ginsengisegetis]|uniref:DNA-binding response regulator, OmpR family, contains REC and winged-helix (WHTH) domain n=1 Tax=Chitinophaga ginsengisegetis TaxID=393003 RepID=A0A1T5P237_9BACT|nr:response regulator transcription factor [Chitinophaga ginsengisegetis]SKD06772.1 DNA-binding response regulator, OmpR family, contains REC and winged-helix (wHTH) domain [Chitinophaga ginsengisegetis]